MLNSLPEVETPSSDVLCVISSVCLRTVARTRVWRLDSSYSRLTPIKHTPTARDRAQLKCSDKKSGEIYSQDVLFYSFSPFSLDSRIREIRGECKTECSQSSLRKITVVAWHFLQINRPKDLPFKYLIQLHSYSWHRKMTIQIEEYC